MTTQVFLLLDMSGSMQDGKEMTVDACNEFITGQKSGPGVEESAFTLAVFNSNIGLERIVKEAPMDRVPLIEHEHYQPDGVTPLYDAIGTGMDLLEHQSGPVLFIIQTDGYENSSQKVTREDVIRRVAEKTAAGWQFVYLGCDIDAMRNGEDIGISAGNTMAYGRLNTKAAFQSLSTSTYNYRVGQSIPSPDFFRTEEGDAEDKASDTGR